MLKLIDIMIYKSIFRMEGDEEGGEGGIEIGGAIPPHSKPDLGPVQPETCTRARDR